VTRGTALVAAVAALALMLGGAAAAATGGGTQAPKGLSIGRARRADADRRLLGDGGSGEAVGEDPRRADRRGDPLRWNTAGGAAQTKRLIESLQRAAAAAHQPGLLV
jgi:hypothetical protein